MKTQIKNLEELHQYAENFIQNIKADNDQAVLVLLSGDLGTGKTAFVKECAKIFDIQEDITSPTFVIQKEYELHHQSWKQMIHIDAYRLEHRQELELLGWDHCIQDAQNIIFLEWPEMVEGIEYPRDNYQLSFSIVEGEHREITQK